MNFELRMTALAGLIFATCVLFAQSGGLRSAAHYRHDGPALLPDAHLSPGKSEIHSAESLCPHADTAARRNVTEVEKKLVCAEYGIAGAKCTGADYEIDHIVSLELGGSNDIRNLFPQPYAPSPGAHEKDQVEDWLHAQVCSGKIPLSTAQREIAADWYTLYLQMEKSQ